MSFFSNGVGPWLKANTLTGLVVLSMGDIIVARRCARPASIIATQRAVAYVYDAVEDRAYWRAQLRRDISEAEHHEIHANLVRFAKLLMAQAQRNRERLQ